MALIAPVEAAADEETDGVDHGPRKGRHALSSVPVAGSVAFVLVTLSYVLGWGPLLHHVKGWYVPVDFRIDYLSTLALVQGHIGAIYGSSIGLITFPGVLVVLAPGVEVGQVLHLTSNLTSQAVTTPTTWLVLEPFDLIAGCAALFAVDAVARRLDVPVIRRWVLMAVEVAILWDLLDDQWHPEDALAVAFALWALLAAFDSRWPRCGWFLGAALAFQPLVVLVLVVALALVPRRHALGLVIRAAVPGAALLAGPLIADPRATLRAVIVQPGWPSTNHPTPMIHFAPHLADGAVAGGPGRLVAVTVAGVVSWIVSRRTNRIEIVVWVMALCFAARSLFEAVMVSYYIWPALAVSLIVAARGSRARFTVACALSSYATVFALHDWRGEWAWWSVMVVCIGTTLVVAWPAPCAVHPLDHRSIRDWAPSACGCRVGPLRCRRR